MGAKSKIEWTDASWNPVTGCSKVSPGCANCYAESLSLRRGWSTLPWTPANAAANVVLHPDRLDYPLRWRQPKRIFVNSMSDLFHELVPQFVVDQVFAVMALAPWHTYQVLTKRPERLRAYLSKESTPRFIDAAMYPIVQRREPLQRAPHLTEWPLTNVWLGTSVENQHWADVRIPLLLDTPATVRFLSCEPLLGPISLDPWFGLQPGHAWDCLCADIDAVDRPCISCEGRRYLGERSGLHWVIVGGESGAGHRPFQADWARVLRDQCVAAGVPYFFKQYGGHTPKAGGRLLDGQEWSQFPATVEVAV